MRNFSRKFLFSFFIVISITIVFFFVLFGVRSASAATFVFDDIKENTIWTPEGSPYVIESNINVLTGNTLTIEGDVIIKFDGFSDTGLNVYGDLVVNGDVNNKVYFTSYFDDSIGGDTDGDYYCDPGWDEDGNEIQGECYNFNFPSVGDWPGINFLNSHNNYMRNVVFRYADNAIFLDHSYLNLKNIEILESVDDAVILNTSNVDGDGVGCLDILGSCLIAYNSSNVNWINSIIRTINSDAIDVYFSSNLNIADSSIENIDSHYHDSIMIFGDSFVKADDVSFTNDNNFLSNYVDIFNGSNLTMNDSSMVDCPTYACVEIFDGDSYINTPSSFDIENSTLSDGGGNGIVIFGNSVINGEIHNSKIVNFPNYAIDIFGWSNKNINAEDNFWGNATGPYNKDKNPNGTAGVVADQVEFIPFCTQEVCASRPPVILIPGIMGSEILKNYDDQKELWPNINKMILSINDDFMNDLALLPDGSEDANKTMQLGDIIRSVKVDMLGYKYESHVFDGLINELEFGLKKNGYVEGKNLFVFPYDWRKSSIENSSKLKAKIDAVLTETGVEKLDVVAHSMGGLVAKKYVADNGSDKINNLIFMGTPHLGAPKVFKVLMYGDNMGISKGIFSFLSPERVKYISQNMPGVYELLPSRKYVDGEENFAGTKYVTDMTAKNERNLSYAETKDFMIKNGRNSAMFNFNQNLHDSIDDLDLSGLKVSNFVGCGETKTVGKIVSKKKRFWTSLWTKLEDTYDLKYVNGDDTVPVHSADLSVGKRYYVKGSTHSELPSAMGLKEYVLAILRGRKLPTFQNVSDNQASCYVSGKVLSFVGYVDMMEKIDIHIYDAKGNHAGPVSGQDNIRYIENGITGVGYNQIGGSTYIFLPSGGSYRIVSNVINNGGSGNHNINNNLNYDLQIENVNGQDVSTGVVEFNNVPQGDTGQNVIEIPDSSFVDNVTEDNSPVINVDNNGDGVPDSQIPPDDILNETQTQDETAPSTTSVASSNSVSLVAEDDNSGVANISYSLDGGNTWTNYVGPIDISSLDGGGNITIQYFATDKAGNVEPIQFLVIPGKKYAINSVGHTNEKKMIAINNENESEIENDLHLNKFTIKEEFTKVAENIKKMVSNKLVKVSKNDYSTSLTAEALDTRVKIDWFNIVLAFISLVFIILIAKKFIKR